MSRDFLPRRPRAAALLSPLILFTGAYALTLAETRRAKRQPEGASETEPDRQPGSLFPRPLEGNYPATLAIAIIALVPFIIVSTAYALFTRQIGGDLVVGERGLAIISGLSVAGYAFGALAGGYAVQRFRQRILFFVCEAGFVAGCIMSAVAGSSITYGAGRVLSGFATGLLLVVALPPVIQRFPPEKLPVTVVFINIGFFGAVCIGPLLGGAVAAGHVWRWFYAGLGGIAALNLVAALFTLPALPPFNPDVRFDPAAIICGLLGVALPFWAAGELSAHGFASLRFAVPLATGLGFFIVLLLAEYHQKEPLSPIKAMWTTSSVVGTLVAMIGGGVFVAFLELAERFQMEVVHRSPLQTGLLFWPLAGGVCITAVLLGALLRTRFLPLLVLAGMALLIGGGALLMNLGTGGAPGLTLAAAGLLGLGAGATVSPGLYLAGFPLSSQIIGRVFALVELVRSLCDYILAPVMAKIAQEGSAKPPLDWAGVHEALAVTLWLTVAFTLLGTALWLAGGMGLPKPDIIGWIKERKPAIESPPLLARFRSCR